MGAPTNYPLSTSARVGTPEAAHRSRKTTGDSLSPTPLPSSSLGLLLSLSLSLYPHPPLPLARLRRRPPGLPFLKHLGRGRIPPRLAAALRLTSESPIPSRVPAVAASTAGELPRVAPRYPPSFAECCRSWTQLNLRRQLSICYLLAIVLSMQVESMRGSYSSDAVLMSYVFYVGSRVLSLVINKALRRRVSLLMLSVLFFLPIRVLLLGFSVLPQPGDVAFEVIIFLSFLVMLSCITVGVLLLVYYPVADSLALQEIGHREIAEMVPFDDYYCEGASLVANQSFREIERNSDTSTKPGSISFRTMIREDQLQQDCVDEIGLSSRSGAHIGSPSPSSSSPSAGMPMLPLKEVPRY
ncbi:hypothetical protein GUJ93_ZPchr0007g6295 [Zizania palustris]|uniref:Uncharacterized protein n=1 Tax=Zizania palustris TaxID=103762 RepID=A0A8J5TCT3_ZIZPA|nr:hypothetical protein GUJ93_ZPchr0007g6295 [Zizania palustris]